MKKEKRRSVWEALDGCERCSISETTTKLCCNVGKEIQNILDRSVEVWNVLGVGRLTQHLSLYGVHQSTHGLHCLGGTSVSVATTSSTAESTTATSGGETTTTATVTSSTSASTE